MGTPIQGKIFPMYNKETGANRERRFPITVMEAVLGLSSYLQNQFSALADIYMPIDGISEAFTNQEFVYRKSPNTIKAKSLTLDRIKGKTLAWNQMVPDNSIEGNGTDNSYVTICSVISSSVHKYYARVKCSGSNVTRAYLVGEDAGGVYTEISLTKRGDIYSDIVAIGGYYGEIFFRIGTTTYVSWEGAQLIDLTIMFGAGNEPSTVADFEALYHGIYPYNPGTLKSNDAEAVETTGANQWDEEWEEGDISDTTGENVSNSSCLRSKNYIGVIQNSTMYFKSPNAGTHLYFYNQERGFLSHVLHTANTTFTVPDNAAYMRFVPYTDYGTTYNHDICINLSNPAINGQYFPYWKRTLQLGLKNIKVKSPNIWDEEWEVGGIVGGTVNSKNFISVLPSTTYYFKTPENNVIFYYDANHNQIGTSEARNATFTTPANCAFFKFRMSADYGTTYNRDITINISNPAFNGRYFPSGTLTLEGGVKSAGNVYDEIRDGKYIKRIGRVDLGTLSWVYNSGLALFSSNLLNPSLGGYATPANAISANYMVGSWAQVAEDISVDMRFVLYTSSSKNVHIRNLAKTDIDLNNGYASWLEGVMLDYELAYEEIYDLVEPLIYTTKAGTTEERISPNSDGLSAPFCCDMTYSANENNDAGNAQYAATAGRLLNSHKIWGQDFNGSEDVSGNLVSNGILQGTQLKSTAQTGAAPLIVSSTTTVANLVAEKASKLLTARTIWGQNFDGSGDISGAISNITTLSASGLATIAGGIALGTSANAQAAKIVWDETNNAWHLKGNLYVDGFVTAGGINNQE